MCFYQLCHCVIFNNTFAWAVLPLLQNETLLSLILPVQHSYKATCYHGEDSHGCFLLVTCEQYIPDHNRFHSYLYNPS